MSINLDGVYYRPKGFDRWILEDISLGVEEGELVVIAGPSGSGKTMLLYIISGIAKTLIGGEIRGSVTVEKSGGVVSVGFLPQSFENSLLSFDVRNELQLSLRRDSLEKFERIVEELNLEGLLDRYVFNLSYGEMQRVALASIILSNYDVVLLDEPLAHLDKWSVRGLLKVLKYLKEEGKTIIVAEHRINNFVDLADKFILLRGGKKVLEGNYSDVRGYAREMGLRVEYRKFDLGHRDLEEEVVRVENLVFWWSRQRRIFNDLDFELPRGAIKVIYGANGSGKTTLGLILADYIKEYGGKVDRKGKITYVPQNPDRFLIYDSVFQEVYTPLRNAELSKKEAEKRAMDILNRFGLENRVNLDPFLLSKGEKYRLAVASAVASGADLIILDEPTYGQDYRSLFEILSLLKEFVVEEDKSALLLTCDFDFYQSLSGEKFVLDKGVLTRDYL